MSVPFPGSMTTTGGRFPEYGDICDTEWENGGHPGVDETTHPRAQ